MPTKRKAIHYANLNEALLEIILLIQRARSYFLTFASVMGEDVDIDWELRRIWETIPDHVFKRAGITSCNHNLNMARQFVVKTEYMQCQAEDLCQYTTGFYGREV